MLGGYTNLFYEHKNIAFATENEKLITSGLCFMWNKLCLSLPPSLFLFPSLPLSLSLPQLLSKIGENNLWVIYDKISAFLFAFVKNSFQFTMSGIFFTFQKINISS